MVWYTNCTVGNYLERGAHTDGAYSRRVYITYFTVTATFAMKYLRLKVKTDVASGAEALCRSTGQARH